MWWLISSVIYIVPIGCAVSISRGMVHTGRIGSSISSVNMTYHIATTTILHLSLFRSKYNQDFPLQIHLTQYNTKEM